VGYEEYRQSQNLKKGDPFREIHASRDAKLNAT
jgi:hypothetical protein